FPFQVHAGGRAVPVRQSHLPRVLRRRCRCRRGRAIQCPERRLELRPALRQRTGPMDDPDLLEPIGFAVATQVRRVRTTLRAQPPLQSETQEGRMLDQFRVALLDLALRSTPVEGLGWGGSPDAYQIT